MDLLGRLAPSLNSILSQPGHHKVGSVVVVGGGPEKVLEGAWGRGGGSALGSRTRGEVGPPLPGVGPLEMMGWAGWLGLQFDLKGLLQVA